MKTHLIFACFTATVLFANSAWAQSNWPPQIIGPTIEVVESENLVRVEVTGTMGIENIVVDRIGSNAIVGVYNQNGYLVTSKWIRGNSLPTFQLTPNPFPLGSGAERKRIGLVCDLKGGDDSFRCDATTFDFITVAAGDGDDVVLCGPVGCLVYGGRGDDMIFGSDQFDFMDGGEGNDLVSGGGGDDVMFGGNGSDRLFATFGGVDKVVTGDLFRYYAYDEIEDDAIDYFAIDGNDSLVKGRFDYGTIAVVFD